MIGAAIRKDVWLLIRDRGALVSLFVLPIIFIVAFGSMFKFGGENDPRPRKIPIWTAGDARGLAIVKALGEAQGFAPDATDSAEAVREKVASGDAQAGLVVPAAPAPVELSIDLGAPIAARAPIQGALTGVVMRALAPPSLANLPPPLVAVTPPGIAKPLDDISAFQVTVPGNAVLFGFFIALTTAMSFVAERKTGTWRRLLAAPVPRWKALLATLVPYFVVGCCQMAFLFGIGAAAFGMKVAGSVPALCILSACVSLCAVCLGLLFAAFATTEKQLGGIGSVVLLVMGLLGGCMMPRLVMPAFMQSLGHVVPHSWALDGYYALLVRQGTSIADTLPAIEAVLGFAAAFALVGIWRFRFEK
ncbi:MAG TPA: ABC transporter permease [Kofleriaceae bacterium]|jgi:ABC-2 type transport system permease protein